MLQTQLKTGWFCSDLNIPDNEVAKLKTIIDLDDGQEWWSEEQVEKHYLMMSDSHRKEVNRLRENRNITVGTIYRRKRHGKMRSEVRFDGIAGCLRTPKGGSARQIVIAVSKSRLQMRWMSPLEYAKLQGAGDFQLVGKVNQQLFGFGDAVCVPALTWIGENILNPLANGQLTVAT